MSCARITPTVENPLRHKEHAAPTPHQRSYEGVTLSPYTQRYAHTLLGASTGDTEPPRRPGRCSPVTSSPPEWLQESSFGFASHGDDDLSSSVSSFQIPDGLGDLGEWVRPVDDRCDLAGFDELLEDDHVLVVLL